MADLHKGNGGRKSGPFNGSGLDLVEYFAAPAPTLSSRIRSVLRRFPLAGRLLKAGGPKWRPPDGVQTVHNKSFFTSELFSKSYRRAIDAGGFDYRVPFRIHQVLWAVHSVLHLDGDFVELGTGKGFVMSAALASIEDWNARTNTCYLYDVFQKPEVSGFGKLNYASYYADSCEQVTRNFAEWKRVTVVAGDVFTTLAANGPEKVSFLHVDLNDAEAEVHSLRLLWPRVVRGGIVILDDYANRGHEKQYEALNNLFAEFERPVLTTPSGQGIVLK